MTKETAAQDKIRLLMEETGCDQWQAELALTSAAYDVEKAVRTIGTLLRNIVVARAKFSLPERNLYGLLILIADVKRRSLFRGRAVVSYNPALFETPLGMNWYDFERGLYAFRLWEGTLQQVTQDLERALLERLESPEGEDLYDLLRDGPEEGIRERLRGILAAHFPGGRTELSVLREELNLDQFRRLRPEEEAHAAAGADRPQELPGGGLRLSVDLQEAADGVPAREVKEGDSVYVLITDERDIAQYLSKLLGGRRGEGWNPLTATVEHAGRRDGAVVFHIRLAAGILGVAQAQEGSLLRVQKAGGDSWWRRWLSFSPFEKSKPGG
ncbi:MAG: hypothetical protein ACT4O3_07125 [Elusimicrobiota bacterium]